MSNVAIRVENLSKQYRIGPRESYKTLRESLTNVFTAPFNRKNLQSAIRNPQSNHPPSSISHPRFDTIWALKDVSFEVKHGEVIGIIGPNGAGKTTLLKILSRITEPTEGEVELRGRVSSLLEVGTGFHPELTGRENIFLNGAILGMSKAEINTNFDEIVAFAEVEKFLDTPVKHYSTGMGTRLAFAIAAHLEPEILLVDEVLAVGDIEFQKKCIGKIEKVAGEGKTAVMVSHSMSTVKALCSKAILLERGVVRTLGPVDGVVNTYLSANQVDAAEKVISDEDHLTGVNKIRVRRIRLLNGVENRFFVYWQQPISVSVEIEVLEQVDDVSFGAGIKLADGTWILSVHHDDDGVKPRWTLEPGRHTIKFTLQNDLKPGIYKLAVGAHHHHYLSNLFHIETVNLGVLEHTEQGLVPLAYNPGVVNGCLTFLTLKPPERVP